MDFAKTYKMYTQHELEIINICSHTYMVIDNSVGNTTIIINTVMI